MLGYLVEDLVTKGKLHEAKGICIRNNIFHKIKEPIREKLADVYYDPKKEPKPYDAFGPLSDNCF